MSVGFEHACGVAVGGQVKCWGSDDLGEAASPGPSGVFIDVDTNGSAYGNRSGGISDVTFALSCGVRSGGQIECWGNNDGNEDEFLATPSNGMFTMVSVGSGWIYDPARVCGLRTNGQIQCWAYSLYTDVPEGQFTAVSAGTTFECGLRSSREVNCWGLNDRVVADTPEGKFSALSARSAHVCGVRTNGHID